MAIFSLNLLFTIIFLNILLCFFIKYCFLLNIIFIFFTYKRRTENNKSDIKPEYFFLFFEAKIMENHSNSFKLFDQVKAKLIIIILQLSEFLHLIEVR